MQTTTFIRSTNDYSVSLHEIFGASATDQPKSSSIVHFTGIGFDRLDLICEKIVELFNQHEYSIKSELDVEYDDNLDKPDQYSVYRQIVIIFAKNKTHADIDNKSNSDIIGIELLAAKNLVCCTALSSQRDSHKKLVSDIKQYRSQICVKSGLDKNKTFFTIGKNSHGFELQSFDITTITDDIDVDFNYNDNFKECNDVIQNAINDNKRGLVLLHGIPGSGKTSYIKYLINKGFDRKIIYIPTHLATFLASPDFISFVKEELSKCVLVIEDAESVLLDRENPASNKEAVSNILNLTDGILADALNVMLICTFNQDIDNLDNALLRKGRLLLQYEFDKLTLEKSNKLSQRLYNKNVNQSMTLTDIYNLDYELIKPEEPKKVSFGFTPQQ